MANTPDFGLQQAQRLRTEMLRTDLDLCSTFIDTFEIRVQLGELEAAKRILEKAEKAHRTVSQMAQEEPDSANRTELFQNLNSLQERLEAARNRLSSAG